MHVINRAVGGVVFKWCRDHKVFIQSISGVEQTRRIGLTGFSDYSV